MTAPEKDRVILAAPAAAGEPRSAGPGAVVHGGARGEPP